MKLTVRFSSKKEPIPLKSACAILFVIALILLTFSTFFQGVYNVLLHVALLGMCFLVIGRLNQRSVTLLIVSVLPMALLVGLSFNNVSSTPIAQIGFFLHYISWIVLLLAVNETFSDGQKRFLIRLIIVIAIISNLASIAVLLTDADASRLLAGSVTEKAQADYYSRGLGGYGYVYAMVFLTYGAIVWLINTKNRFEKILLIVYLITNYLFLLLSSYTLAIIFALVLTVAALTTKMQFVSANVLLVTVALLIILLGEPLLNLGINFAEKMDLPWIVKRLSQLNEAQMTGDYMGLTRSQLYLRSLQSFAENPLTGQGVVGGHAHMLDWLGMFGICAIPAMWLMYVFCREAYKIGKRKNFVIFYIIFFVFTFIDTCSAMQIPVIVLFGCPLILNLMSSQETKPAPESLKE